MDHRLSPERYLEAIAADSARFVELLAGAEPSAPVESCPDWDASDLLWHLTEVQWFWSVLVTDRPGDPSVTEGRRPERPADHERLSALFRQTSQGLLDALGAATDDETAWTWADEQTVGFIRRRQAHEALIHRLDAELVVGAPSGLDPALATDGVDEALVVMFAGIPDWAIVERQHGPVEVRTTDTAARWLVDVGLQRGVSPGSGEPVTGPTLVVSRPDDTLPVARISAHAAALDSWLWGRAGDRELSMSGDDKALAAFREVIGTGID